jgi:hypothetical protein
MGSEHILVDLQQSNWYVLFVRSNQEKRIALRLNNSGIEHLLSCYTSKRQWKDRCVRLGVPPTSPKRLSEETVLAQLELVAMLEGSAHRSSRRTSICLRNAMPSSRRFAQTRVTDCEP